MRLSVIAFDKAGLTQWVLQLAKRRSVYIFVGRLGAQDTTKFCQDAIDRGATGLQTNDSEDLVKFLRKRRLHEYTSKRALSASSPGRTDNRRQT
jgi:hypothetical protein